MPADRTDEARRLMDEFAGPEDLDGEPQSSAPWTWGRGAHGPHRGRDRDRHSRE